MNRGRNPSGGRRYLGRAHNIIRVLSKKGVCSRKQAVDLVLGGRVRVNGRVLLDPGRKVKAHECILLDGKTLPENVTRYILFHKPAGYVTTRKDERGRKTVYDLLGDVGDWVFPVGRLDRDTEGLLILTNDTSFGERLANPRFRIPRTYRVRVEGRISREELERMAEGMDIGRGERTRPAKIEILGQDHASAHLEITLAEGKNREIRRLFEAIGKPITRLVRTRFGPFRLGNLPPGKWKEVRPKKGFWK
jgi:23S rRNA pseudouridine2605 synthase